MPGDDFLGAFDLGGGNWLDDDTAPAPQRVEDLFAVDPSRLKAPGKCVCCPKCKGLHVRRNDNGKAESAARWECLEPACRQGWKEPAGLRVVRCYVVIDT